MGEEEPQPGKSGGWAGSEGFRRAEGHRLEKQAGTTRDPLGAGVCPGLGSGAGTLTQVREAERRGSLAPKAPDSELDEGLRFWGRVSASHHLCEPGAYVRDPEESCAFAPGVSQMGRPGPGRPRALQPTSFSPWLLGPALLSTTPWVTAGPGALLPGAGEEQAPVPRLHPLGPDGGWCSRVRPSSPPPAEQGVSPDGRSVSLRTKLSPGRPLSPRLSMNLHWDPGS